MEETNKLIAEFMGLDTEVFKSGKVNYYYYDKVSKQEIFLEAHELSYNVSWDWLMPVIEKCLVGEAEQSEEISNTTIKNIYEGICNQDISFAYKSVVEFIKENNDERE